MAGTHSTSIGVHFAPLTDPRVERAKEHLLVDIVTIALCAVICGADSRVGVATFGQAKEGWLRTFPPDRRPQIAGASEHESDYR